MTKAKGIEKVPRLMSREERSPGQGGLGRPRGAEPSRKGRTQGAQRREESVRKQEMGCVCVRRDGKEQSKGAHRAS